MPKTTRELLASRDSVVAEHVLEREHEWRKQLGYCASMTSDEFHDACKVIAKMVFTEFVQVCYKSRGRHALTDKQICADILTTARLLIPSSQQQDIFFYNRTVDEFIDARFPNVNKLSCEQAFNLITQLGGVTGRHVYKAIEEYCL